MKFSLPQCQCCSDPAACHNCPMIHEWVDERIAVESFPSIDVPGEECTAAKDCDFAVRMIGDGMFPLVHSGDVLFCRLQQDVQDDDIAVAMVDDSLEIGRVFKLQNAVVLRPANRDFAATTIGTAPENKSDSASVVGIVIALHRNLLTERRK